MSRIARRDFLRETLLAAGPRRPELRTAPGPDANRIELPVGFRSRVVAVSGGLGPGTSHVWHGQPDAGEGISYENGTVHFTTKGDNRVWSFNAFRQKLYLIHDAATSPNPILTHVDDVLVTPVNDVFVAEDSGDLRITAIASNGTLQPVVRVTGQALTEITGPALDPSGTRLFFSSQRGGANLVGIPDEVTGPFLV